MARIDRLNPIQQYLVHEFVEDYQDGLMSRRGLVGRVLRITGNAAAAATILTALGVKAGGAEMMAVQAVEGAQSPLSVDADDPRVVADEVTFPAADGATLMAYVAKPAGAGGTSTPATPVPIAPFPVVLVCHENRGMNDHVRDVARRYAVNSYLAVAIDLLSREGGTAAVADPEEIPAILSEGDPNRHVADFQSAITWLGEVPEADLARLGMNGFCFGGGITWLAATQVAELKAAVPFYGPPPPLDAVPNIKAAVLGVYSDDPDDFANNGRDELVAALEAAGVTHQINVYPDSQHAFHNDTGQRYSEAAALAAWEDTLNWFATYLVA
jgi:carboxymethylenebutenolidase